MPATTIATWPIGTFVENLVVRRDGTIVVSITSLGELQEVTPGGQRRTLARLPAEPTGLVLTGDDVLVNVGHPGQAGWRIVRVGRDGAVTPVVDVPEARFLNGATPLDERRLLAVDAALGRVFLVDLPSRRVTTWLEHEWLTKTTPAPMMPGVNGIKAFRGHVYLTSTERALIVRVALAPDGSAGAVTRVAERFLGDDFALDVDGNLYVATHVYATLERLAPDGERVILGDADDGLDGATAVAFGRTEADGHAVYVTTTGGMIGPREGQVRPARLVRCDVGRAGAPLDRALESLYQHLGGQAALGHAVDVFYASVLRDPLLQPLFGEGKPHHVAHLTAFMAEVFGGPRRYSDELGGFATILEAHRRLGIREEQRRRFVELLIAAADIAGLPADAPFRAAWAEHAELGSQVAMQNANARDDSELHPLREVPLWTWPAGAAAKGGNEPDEPNEPNEANEPNEPSEPE